MPAFVPPPDYARIKVVSSFSELIETPFANGLNALCWDRNLPGDFGEIVQRLGEDEGIASIDDATLLGLTLSDAGKIARDILLQDQQLLRAHDLAPSLDCIHHSPRDLSGGPVPTDVQSFHVDSATVPADTYLCSYAVSSSEGLRNDQAIRHIDIPETRAELLKLYGGKDDEGFGEFLSENFYDLHYAPMPGAQPFSFGLGRLWRIALDYPGSPVPPCIHRAPATIPGQPPRLLLIS